MKKKIILIVDDEPININIVADILYEKYQVRVARNGKMALELLEKKRPDLILLDVMMPDMSGYEVATQLKKNPDTKSIPFIFLTAKRDPRSIMEGFNYGAVDYISKPFSKEELLARVGTQLKIDEFQKSISGTAEFSLKIAKEEVAFYKKTVDENILLLEVDLDGYIISVSQAFCDAIGSSQEEFIEAYPRLERYLDLPQELREELEQFMQQDLTWSADIAAKTKESRVYHMKTTISPHFDEKSKKKIGYRVVQRYMKRK